MSTIIKEKEYAIKLTDVKKTFDGKEFVVNGMNLAIPKGSLTAIIGFPELENL